MSSPVFHFHLVPITRTYLWGEMNINLGRTTGLSSCSSLITYLKVSHLLVSLAFSKASFFVSLCAICSHPSYLVSITRSSNLAVDTVIKAPCWTEVAASRDWNLF